jgi:hypothetical protein
MEWCWKSCDGSDWLHKALKFVVANLEKLELKLEVNLPKVECLFHEVHEFVIEDYVMLKKLWQWNLPLWFTKMLEKIIRKYFQIAKDITIYYYGLAKINYCSTCSCNNIYIYGVGTSRKCFKNSTIEIPQWWWSNFTCLSIDENTEQEILSFFTVIK